MVLFCSPQGKVSRIGELLKLFSKECKVTDKQSKSVRFSWAGTTDMLSADVRELVDRRTSVGNATNPVIERLREENLKEEVGDFVGPVVCAVCATCAALVYSSRSLQHSELLSSLLRLYGNRAFVKCLVSHLEGMRRSVSAWQPRAGQQSMLMVLCTSLFRIVDFERFCSSEDSTRLAESVMETVIVLTYSGEVTEESASLYLSEVAKVCFYTCENVREFSHFAICVLLQCFP